ncbi:TetR/AcrR family transcriptional regulator [Enterococcus faecium]|nr:TetR/AcrR family transcriptional regulator [Enterococcus faecium]
MKNEVYTTNKAIFISEAWKVLAESGLEGFSMRKLAVKVGKTVSTLYHYFPNKEVLFAELIEHALEELIYPVDSLTWQDKFMSYGENILDVLNNSPYLAQLMLEIPPNLPNYQKLNDNLLMIANDIPIKKIEKLFFVNMYMNFILNFKMDADRLSRNSTEKVIEHTKDNLQPFLSSYREGGYFDKLGSTEMFYFGLKLLIFGIDKKTF